MSYQRSRLGQDEDVIWSNVDWNIPGGGEGAVYTPSDWSGVDWTKSGGIQYPSRSFPASPQPSSDWWGGFKDILVPLSSAAVNLIRGITGKAPPPGSSYNPRTGQIVPPGGSGLTNWLIPALLLGGGAILLLRKR